MVQKVYSNILLDTMKMMLLDQKQEIMKKCLPYKNDKFIIKLIKANCKKQKH